MASTGDRLCSSQVAVSLHVSLLSKGCRLREEAETVTETGTGNGRPGVSQGNGLETGDRRGGPSAGRCTAFLFKHKEG